MSAHVPHVVTERKAPPRIANRVHRDKNAPLSAVDSVLEMLVGAKASSKRPSNKFYRG